VHKEVLAMKLSHQLGVYAVIALVAAALVPVGLAGNAGARKNGSSLSLVVLDSSGNAAASTAPQWGSQVTFDVTSNAAYPSVELDCSQSGALVYQQIVGFYPTFADQTFTLKSFYWTGGAASCNATLYTMTKNGSRQTLATMSFDVAA
jgi:hypothetical protein